MYNMKDTTKIGVGLTAFGSCLFVLGVMLFLDSALLTLGNLLFICGVILIMGAERCKAFFLNPAKRRSTACFFVGILMVMWGHCFIGLLIQGFGGLNLFGNFFPTILGILQQLPFIGNVLRHPAIAGLIERLTDISNKRNV